MAIQFWNEARPANTGAELGKGLGQGLSAGLQYLTNRKIKQMEEEQESLQNERAMKKGVYNGFKDFSPRFQDALLKEAIAKNALTDLLDRSSPEQRKEIEQRIVNDPSLLSNIQQGEQPQQQPQIAQMPQRGGLGALLQNQQQPQQAPIAQQFAQMGSRTPFQQQQMPLAQQFASMGAYHPRDEFPAPQAPQVMAPSQQEQPQYQGQVAENITPRQTLGAPQGAQQQQLEPAKAETREEAFKRKLSSPKPLSPDTQAKMAQAEGHFVINNLEKHNQNVLNRYKDNLSTIIKRAGSSKDNIRDWGQIKTLAKSGQLRSGNAYQIMERLGLEDFGRNVPTEIAQKIIARLAQNAGSAFNTSRLTNLDVNLYQRSLATLRNTDKGIAALADINILADKANIIKDNARKEIEQQYSDQRLPNNLLDIIEAKSEPELKKLGDDAVSIIQREVYGLPTVSEFKKKYPGHKHADFPDGTTWTIDPNTNKWVLEEEGE